MIYSVDKLSISHVKAFNKYLHENGLCSWSNESQYNLLSYCLCKMYGLESSVYTKGIDEYGKSCEEYLSSQNHIPRRRDKISFGDRVSIVSLSQAYFVSAFLMNGVKGVVLNGNKESL